MASLGPSHLLKALQCASAGAALVERGDAAEACAMYRKAIKQTAKAVRCDAELGAAAELMADELLAKLGAIAAGGEEEGDGGTRRRIRCAALVDEPLAAAARALESDGVVVVERDVTEDFDALRRAAKAIEGLVVDRVRRGEFSALEAASRCRGRVDVKLDACGHDAFDAPARQLSRFAQRDDRWLWPLARRVLGDDVVLAYVGLVVSFPGSADQPWHSDGVKLFPGDGSRLPAHALNCFVPLVDVGHREGPTNFVPGSHRPAAERALNALLREGRRPKDVFAPTLSAGDCLVYDQRTVHRGVANTGHASRPILYLLFARPWFREHVNFGKTSLFALPPPEDRKRKKRKTRSFN